MQFSRLSGPALCLIVHSWLVNTRGWGAPRGGSLPVRCIPITTHDSYYAIRLCPPIIQSVSTRSFTIFQVIQSKNVREVTLLMCKVHNNPYHVGMKKTQIHVQNLMHYIADATYITTKAWSIISFVHQNKHSLLVLRVDSLLSSPLSFRLCFGLFTFLSSLE